MLCPKAADSISWVCQINVTVVEIWNCDHRFCFIHYCPGALSVKLLYATWSGGQLAGCTMLTPNIWSHSFEVKKKYVGFNTNAGKTVAIGKAVCWLCKMKWRLILARHAASSVEHWDTHTTLPLFNWLKWYTILLFNLIIYLTYHTILEFAILYYRLLYVLLYYILYLCQ